jgi:hypothetical protein
MHVHFFSNRLIKDIDSCNCGLINTLFDLSEITQEWLESLTQDTTMLIDDEESFLRIHIYNVEI